EMAPRRGTTLQPLRGRRSRCGFLQRGDGFGSFEIRAHDVDQLLRRVLRGRASFRMRERVFANMPFHDDRHQGVHCSSRGGDQAQDFTAVRFGVERPGNRVDLAAKSADAVEQFLFLSDRVHSSIVYPTMVYAASGDNGTFTATSTRWT